MALNIPSAQPEQTPQNPPVQTVVSTPTPAPAPVQASEGPSEEAQTLLKNFMAIDPQRKGVGLDKIRMFYPRVGWDVIHAWVKELEDINVLSHKPVMNQRGSVGYNLYTWKEA